MFMRIWSSSIVIGLLIALMGIIGANWPLNIAAPLEVVTLGALLLILKLLFPDNGGINIASFVIFLTAVVTVLFIGAVTLSHMDPLWVVGVGVVLTAVTVVLSIMRGGQSVAEMRIRMGQCPCCGYDLRASPDRCPECNAAIPAEIDLRRRAADRRKKLLSPTTRSAAAPPPFDTPPPHP